MKITVKASEPKDNQLEAKLTVASADVDAAIKQAYKDIANKYRFQGFRKGKAPRQVIDGMLGRANVLGQATDELLGEATPLMLEELDIVPLGQVSFGEYPAVEEGKDYKVTATLNLRPDAELSSYDAPTINMPPEEVTDAEVEEQLDALMAYQATFEDADEKTYKVESGDMLTVSIEDVKNAEALAGDDRPYMIGAGAGPAELDDAIKGMKIGATKTVKFKNGTEDVELKVTVKSAKQRVTPELTDELASKSFGYDDVAALKEAVKDEVAEDKKVQMPSLKENRVIEAITEKLKLDEVPEDYRKEIFDEIAQDFLGQLQRQGMTLDAWLSARRISAGDFINDLNEQALERARQSLALDALAKKLDLKATAEDIKAEFEKAGAENVEKTIEEFKNAGRLPAVRESIKRSKALDWLVENAKVNFVDEIAERRAAAGKDGAKKTTKKTAAKKTTAKKADGEAKPAAKKTAAKKTTKKAVADKDAE